jgi:hypothetical protein
MHMLVDNQHAWRRRSRLVSVARQYNGVVGEDMATKKLTTKHISMI